MHDSKLALLLPLMLLAACSKAHFDTPKEALQTFLDRSIEGDKSGARACLVADERGSDNLKFQVDRNAVGFAVGEVEMQGDQAVVAVRFPGESEDMKFVLVEQDGWFVSLSYTLTRGIGENVGRQVDALGPNPTPEQMAEALRRGMQNMPAGR